MSIDSLKSSIGINKQLELSPTRSINKAKCDEKREILKDDLMGCDLEKQTEKTSEGIEIKKTASGLYHLRKEDSSRLVFK